MIYHNCDAILSRLFVSMRRLEHMQNMAEGKENPPAKKRRLSLSLKHNRFKKVSEDDISVAQKGFVPNNTTRCNRWAINNFESWRSHLVATEDSTEESFPKDILLTDDPELLCSCLCKYIMETRKENGQKYPPKTLFNLLSGIQRFMREKKPNCFNIFDEKDVNFLSLHNVMDSFFRQLHSEGVGASPHQSDIISIDEEDLLWSKGVMGIENPKQLLHAVFYYCGLNFCLRGGDEHRALKVSQFTRVVVADPENPGLSTICYQYTEHGSKNNLGGIKQVKKFQPNKIVRHFANPKIGDKCLVRLLDLYLSQRPDFKSENSDSN